MLNVKSSGLGGVDVLSPKTDTRGLSPTLNPEAVKPLRPQSVYVGPTPRTSACFLAKRPRRRGRGTPRHPHGTLGGTVV